mgnify:CR=1 FL=1
MHLIPHNCTPGQAYNSTKTRLIPAWQPGAFRLGVHSIDPSAGIIRYLPETQALVAGLGKIVAPKFVAGAPPCLPPCGGRGSDRHPLVSSSKSHPLSVPPWLSVPTSPTWCYQVFEKDAFVCRHFPAMPPRENPPNPRMAIYEFSDKSRAHLDHVACNSGHLIKSQFCLTYHEQMPFDGEQVKRHLDKWLKSYRRRFPGAGYLWVLEFQQRGVPHFHVFLTIPVDHQAQKKMARSWVRITKGDKLQYWWHCRRKNWIPWDMSNGKYLIKNYCVKIAQKDVPRDFVNVGRFWGCSRNMQPKPTLFGPPEIANLTKRKAVPWEPTAVRHYFDKVLRRYQEKQMNYDRQGNRRRNPLTGKVNRWKNASMIRHESELSGNFKIKNGSKVIYQLLNYVSTNGPDRWSLQAAIKERVPF